MKVLITGGSGFLGTSLIRTAGPEHELTVTYLRREPLRQGVKAVRMDLSDIAAIRGIVKETGPDVVIHTAAATDVEWCEANPKEAMLINCDSTRALAEESEKAGAKMVYVSTDYVFDGGKGNYTENDPAEPVNVYGDSKLRGERHVLEHGNGVVIRTNMYGAGPAARGFIPMIIHNAKSGKEILAAEDQFSSFMFIDRLSSVIWGMSRLDVSGTFHVACRDKMNKHEFALAICEALNIEKGLVKRTDTASLARAFGWTARRPLDTSLNVDKVGRLFVMPTMRESIAEFKKKAEATIE